MVGSYKASGGPVIFVQKVHISSSIYSVKLSVYWIEIILPHRTLTTITNNCYISLMDSILWMIMNEHKNIYLHVVQILRRLTEKLNFLNQLIKLISPPFPFTSGLWV